MGIDPGVEEHQVRSHLLDKARQVIRQQRQIGVVLEAGLQRDVEIAGLLAQRKVDRAVHRERMDARHHRRTSPPCRHPDGRRDRSPAPARCGPRPAARAAAIATSLNTQKPAPWSANAWWLPPAVLQARPCCSARRAVRTVPRAGGARAPHHLCRDRQPDPALRRRLERQAERRLDIGRRVRLLQPGDRRELGPVQLGRRHHVVFEQMRHQAAVLGHRKAVARRHRRAIGGMVDNRQAHGQEPSRRCRPRRGLLGASEGRRT